MFFIIVISETTVEFEARNIDYRDDRYMIYCETEENDKYTLVIDYFNDLAQEWQEVYRKENLTEKVAAKRYYSDSTVKNMYLPLKYSRSKI